jgi:hypothetical protein
MLQKNTETIGLESQINENLREIHKLLFFLVGEFTATGALSFSRHVQTGNI